MARRKSRVPRYYMMWTTPEDDPGVLVKGWHVFGRDWLSWGEGGNLPVARATNFHCARSITRALNSSDVASAD